MNAESLSIRAEDFDRYMSGAATPHDPSQVITTCDGLKLMQQNVAALVDLRARQERLMAEAMQLQQDMMDFCAATREQVSSLLARTPLELRPLRTKVNLDDDPELTEAEKLPPPLQPQVVGTPSRSMCRSLSDFLSNLTETTCTNTSFTPTTSDVTAGEVSETVAVLDSSVKRPTANETPTSTPTVTVNDAGVTADTMNDSCTQHGDDTASVSSLVLDNTMTSNVDISLLDDPFIAIGAGCEKDSVLEDWPADESTTKDFEMTSSPDSSSSSSKAEASEAAVEDTADKDCNLAELTDNTG